VSIAMVWATYLVVGVVVAARAFGEGVLRCRRHPLLGKAETMVLSATSLLVGVLWVLFVPGLIVVGWRSFRRARHARPRRIPASCLDGSRSEPARP